MIAMVVTAMLLLFATAVAQEEACPYNNRGWSIEHWPMNTDQSEKCQSCTTFFRQEQAIWCNDTSIAAILNDLDKECKNKFSIKEPKKRKLCESIAGIAVQIPPGIQDGMMSLSWPLPEALCATLLQCSVDCTLDRTQPPAQVHLSFTSQSSVYGVSWVTYNQTSSFVQYGLSPDNLNLVNEGTHLTYSASGWKGMIHRAMMSNLQLGQTYYYRVGNGVDSWSKVFQYKALTPLQDITFAVLGDIDFEANTTIANIATLAQAGDIQGVLITGDISYADGYEPHWDRFFERAEVFAAYVPTMVTPGNHEFWFNFTSFKKRFYFPGVSDEGGSGDNMFYSWNSGRVHFVSGNSESAIDTAYFSDEYLSWLEKDVAAVDRDVYPFVVNFYHRPMYCSNSDECLNKGGQLLRQQGEQLMNDLQINLVLNGHVHSYERTFPVFNWSATQLDYSEPSSTVHIVQGASGNREGNDGFPTDLPDFSAGRSSEVGFGLLSIAESQLKWSFYAVRDESLGGPYLVDSGFIMTPWKK